MKRSKELGKIFSYVLIFLMTIRICSYFTLFPDSIGVTRVVKIGLRLCTTALSGALLLMLATNLKRFKFRRESLLPLIFYILYLLLGLLSFLWSSGIGFSALQWVMTSESLVFVILFYHLYLAAKTTFPNQIQFSNILGVAIGVICIAFIVGLFIDPELFYRQTHGGEVSRLGGFIINPNELGMLAVLGVSAVLYDIYLKQKIKLNIVILLLCIAVLLLTQSRSSLISFFLVAGLYLYLSDSRKIKLAAIIGAVFAIPVIVRTIIIKTGDIEEVMSMTGRLPFWTDLIMEGFPREPILGFGFMRISYSDKFDSIHAYAASMTHNTFVQVLLNLGLVGAFICILQMATLAVAMKTFDDKNIKLFVIGLLIPLIINSLTEFGIFGESNYGIMFYQFTILFFTVTIVKSELLVKKLVRLKSY